MDLPDGRSVTLIDFSRLRRRHSYLAMVPQWDFLNLLAEAGRAEPTFTLRMRTEVIGLLRTGSLPHPQTGVHQRAVRRWWAMLFHGR